MSWHRQKKNENQTISGLSMNIIGFALCLENSECSDLQLNKIYPIVEPEHNDPPNYLRVIDESEEDYLYLREMFEIVNFDEQVHNRLLENLAASIN
jgi:hypothetical protein